MFKAGQIVTHKLDKRRYIVVRVKYHGVDEKEYVCRYKRNGEWHIEEFYGFELRKTKIG
jgi:hypothetical protein